MVSSLCVRWSAATTKPQHWLSVPACWAMRPLRSFLRALNPCQDGSAGRSSTPRVPPWFLSDAGCSSLGRSFRRTHTCAAVPRETYSGIFPPLANAKSNSASGKCKFSLRACEPRGARVDLMRVSAQTHAVLRGSSGWLPSLFFPTLNSNLHQREGWGEGVADSMFESLEVLDFRVRGHANTFDKFPLVTALSLNF